MNGLVETRPIPATGVSELVLEVLDLERAVAFYRDVLGFPLVRYIDINDSEEVLRAIQMTDDDIALDIVLHTPGGLVLAALQIARAIHEHHD